METQAPYNKKKLIFVCSPLQGDIEGNIERAKGFCRRIVLRGNIPIAPHVYFTQFLNEEFIKEREFRINAGLALLKICDELWVFGDTTTAGMRKEIICWQKMGKQINYFLER